MRKHTCLVWVSVWCALTLASRAAASPPVQEACGQIIVVSYRGAVGAADAITRSKSEARARAETLLKGAQHDDFAAIAKASSDAPSSAARGGVMGTFSKSEWPQLHAAIEAPLFRLSDNQIASKLVEAPYGYVIVKRCKVEKAHSRHLLIRYAGAKNAKSDITRTRQQAEQLARSVIAGIHDDHQFTEAIAKYSEDSSRDRGGDIGSVGRGRLALAFENALFALKIGERSDVIESEFGFHIIERLPEAR